MGKPETGNKSVESRSASCDEQECKEQLLALEQRSDVGFCARQPEVERHSGPDTPDVTGDVSGSVATGRCGQT